MILTFTCYALIPSFTSTQVHCSGASPPDRYRHSDGFRGGGWFGLHTVGLVHRRPLVEVEEELYAMPGGLLERIQRPCRASLSAEWAFGLVPGSRTSTSKHSRAALLDGVLGRSSKSLAKSRMVVCCGGQTDRGAAYYKINAQHTPPKGRSYTQKRRSDSQARSTFCVR